MPLIQHPPRPNRLPVRSGGSVSYLDEARGGATTRGGFIAFGWYLESGGISFPLNRGIQRSSHEPRHSIVSIPA